MVIGRFLKKVITKTGSVISGAFSSNVPEEIMDELEDRLILADAGPRVSMEIVGEIRDAKPRDVEQVRTILKESLMKRIPVFSPPVFFSPPAGRKCPTVWMIFGTNGAGKTTTVAKLASMYRAEKLSVTLIAADTYRAAAIEQLSVWARRVDVPLFKMDEGSSPSAVIFDALSSKEVLSSDLIIVDTAGRLHTKTTLIDELKKMLAVCEKLLPGALTERILLLDGTTGQNAAVQAETYHAALSLTGFIVSKLDASAKAGFLAGGISKLGVPVKWIGTGEQVQDIGLFDPESYISGLTGTSQ